MDSTLPADDPAPELPLEDETAAPEPATDAEPAEDAGTPSCKETLAELTARAEKGRLSAAEEAAAAQAIKGCLLDGRAGVAYAIEQLPKFAWMVAVNGVTAAWPELTAGFRTQLFSGLAKDEADSARRLRLSLARGLFKQDAASAAKLAVGVARDLREKESGALSARDAQMFASVFIGRAKPWLACFPLADLKPADADVFVQCALLAVFTLPHPPATQLGVVKWAAEAGRLEKLHEPALETVKNAVARWPGKWQAALRKEIAQLPEEIAAVLPAPAPAPVEKAREESGGGEAPLVDETGRVETGEEDDGQDDAGSEVPRTARAYPVYVSKTMPPREDAPATPAPRESAPREQPVRAARGAASAATLNIGDALRQIDAHVAYLRAELKTAQSKLKDRETDRRPRRTERASGPIVEGEPTIEELARLNQQLELRNVELQQRIDDLAADSEDRAASFGVSTDQPVTDRDAALRALLALKLQEDFEDFTALERESNDVVVQAHYRTLLRHIFEVLTQEGVGLKNPA